METVTPCWTRDAVVIQQQDHKPHWALLVYILLSTVGCKSRLLFKGIVEGRDGGSGGCPTILGSSSPDNVAIEKYPD